VGAAVVVAVLAQVVALLAVGLAVALGTGAPLRVVLLVTGALLLAAALEWLALEAAVPD